MKIIFKIARAELRTLFYSPIAWFVVFLFYITTASVFSFSMEQYCNFQEVMKDLQPDWFGFDAGIGRYMVDSILGKVLEYIYLFIPLLTMGIINREISNGTIRLLYSSPVSTREIVLGKYFGMLLFNLILVFIFAIFLAAMYCSVVNAEYKWYLSILLGTFLLINAFAAIGLFISCLTGYQIVAAVITFAVFFVLSVISGLWQQYDLIRDITYFLSMRGKASLMMNGLITSRDVIYFLLIIALFIGFALIKMKSTQESKKWTVSAFRYVIFTLIICTLGYFSSRPGYIAYLDVTKNKVNTLHPAMQQVLKELDGSPLTVTLYTNLLDDKAANGLPQARNGFVWGVWEPFIRFYPNIKFKYEYYYDIKDGDSLLYHRYPGKTIEEIVAIEAEMLNIRESIFKAPKEIRKIIDLSPEDMRLVMQLEYKGKKEFLRTYKDPATWPDQHHYAATLKRLTRPKDIRIAFVNGHYERNPNNYAIREYGAHTRFRLNRSALINDGMDTDTISLAENDIPPAINLLVVADPRSAYSEAEQEKIITYLNNGGNAIFYAEPGKQFTLAPVLETIGIHLDNGTVVSPNEHEMPHIFTNKLTKAGNFLAKEPPMELFQDYELAGGRVENEGELNISYKEINGFKIEPVITQPGNNKTWIENGVLVVDSAAPVFNAAEGDVQKDEYVIAVKLSRKMGNREQRIIVAGDADFMSARRMSFSKIDAALYSWTLYNDYPVYTNYPLAPDRFLKMSVAQAKVFTYVFVYLGSGLLLLSAIILLVRRKRK